MTLIMRFLFLSCILLLASCKKKAFKEGEKYKLIFKGTMKPICEDEKQNAEYFAPGLFLCKRVTDEVILLQAEESPETSELHRKNKKKFDGILCAGQSPATECPEFYKLTNATLKYRLFKLHFDLIGDATIEKVEKDCGTGFLRLNKNFLFGTFTLQPN